ncbi:MAG: ribonuclease HII, partial [Caldilineaceae bacterium]
MTERRPVPSPSERPTCAVEESLWAMGFGAVAGVDEAGRGALAGPVVAAAVVAPVGSRCAGVWAAVRDSKQVRPAERARLAEEIRREALAWAVGVIPCTQIDAEGIAPATRAAMMQAIRALDVAAD